VQSLYGLHNLQCIKALHSKDYNKILSGYELLNDIDIPKDQAVLVLIPDWEDEKELRKQFKNAAEDVFSKLWNNDEDEVWNEYNNSVIR